MRINIIVSIIYIQAAFAWGQSHLGWNDNKVYAYVLSHNASNYLCSYLCGEQLLINASQSTFNELIELVGKSEYDKWSLQCMSYSNVQGKDAWYWSAIYRHNDGKMAIIPFDKGGIVNSNKYSYEDKDKLGPSVILVIPNAMIDHPMIYAITNDELYHCIRPSDLSDSMKESIESAKIELIRIEPSAEKRWKMTGIKCEKIDKSKKWYWSITFHQNNNMDNFITIPISCDGYVIGDLEID